VDKFRYLVVEGPIGAGKTTLARRLASRLSAELLLEQPSENPFLARFYQDMARFALPAQLFFLFQRARMIEPLVQPDMFGKPMVADFLLDRTRFSRALRCRAMSWRCTRKSTTRCVPGRRCRISLFICRHSPAR